MHVPFRDVFFFVTNRVFFFCIRPDDAYTPLAHIGRRPMSLSTQERLLALHHLVRRLSPRPAVSPAHRVPVLRALRRRPARGCLLLSPRGPRKLQAFFSEIAPVRVLTVVITVTVVVVAAAAAVATSVAVRNGTRRGYSGSCRARRVVAAPAPATVTASSYAANAAVAAAAAVTVATVVPLPRSTPLHEYRYTMHRPLRFDGAGFMRFDAANCPWFSGEIEAGGGGRAEGWKGTRAERFKNELLKTIANGTPVQLYTLQKQKKHVLKCL